MITKNVFLKFFLTLAVFFCLNSEIQCRAAETSDGFGAENSGLDAPLIVDESKAGTNQGTTKGITDLEEAAAPKDKEDKAKDEKKDEKKIGVVKVNTRLNVRDKPWGTIIGKLYNNERLNIIGREGEWYKIEWNGKEAYCHSQYVTDASSGGGTGAGGGAAGDTDGPVSSAPSGKLTPSDFGYDNKLFKSVFGLVEKFCDANSRYKLGSGHVYKEGYPSETDCSGFVGQLYQKLAALSGIPPVFSRGSWIPTSQNYKSSNLTKKITSAFPPPNPKDLIKPGDVFVMGVGSGGYGHTGIFMGYDKSGNPVIAHSTSSKAKSGTTYAGKIGTTGVRLEVLPKRYAGRWSGVYRLKGTEEMLKKLAGA